VIGIHARGNKKFGIVVAALDTLELVIRIPDLASHPLQFQQRIVIFPALNFAADAAAISAKTVGEPFGPFIRIDFGKRIRRRIAPVIASRPCGAAADSSRFLDRATRTPCGRR
jgi:hypothetical protein